MEELTEWGYGGLGHLDISFFLLPSVGNRPGTNGVGTGFITSGNPIKLELEFPRTPEGHAGQYCTVVGLMRAYEHVCQLFPCFLLVLSSPGVLP